MRTTVVIDSMDGKLLRSDRAAVERAVKHAGCSELSPIDVCCPSGQSMAIRYALAAGAHRTVALTEIQPGLVLFGVGGTGLWGDLLPAQLATQQAAHLILEVLDFELAGEQIECVRDLGRGERELIAVSLPVVLLISNNASVNQYVSRYRQQTVEMSAFAAGSTPSAAQLTQPTAWQQPIAWQPLSPRTKTVDLAHKTAGNAHNRLFATFGLSTLTDAASAAGATGQTDDSHTITDVEECVTHFFRYLAHHGLMASKSVQGHGGHEEISNSNDSQPASTLAPSSFSAMKFTEAVQRLGPARCPRPLSVSTEEFFWKRLRHPRLVTPVRSAMAASGQQPNENGFRNLHQSCQIDPAVLRRPRALGSSKPTAVRGPFPVCNRNI